jgi:hypothetical protein
MKHPQPAYRVKSDNDNGLGIGIVKGREEDFFAHGKTTFARKPGEKIRSSLTMDKKKENENRGLRSAFLRKPLITCFSVTS